MAAITQITVYVKTADQTAADTRSPVWLGIAGREFRLAAADSGAFARGAEFTFQIGENSTIDNGQWIDPRFPQLDTDDLDRYPAYIRMRNEGSEPAWLLERIQVTVNPQAEIKHRFDNPRLVGDAENARIWLDDNYGNVLFLKRFDG
ncbi:hypothetical protein [Streptomyces sp. RFCAC02]|uniref:hypothetical protein n=1 Tax=Streptomyces sp. RFCAC02 TaxID=2499143 RepID=UPI0010206B89|nr:hypothetical protein [Streptomyces sp. RFCAC02]